ncbi:Crp/Fnr family transcriptional regulator [Pedobacter panaciterrae]|jgi:cAMP-binding proteins - catabolite gene activator and regulatory subunit of cAMP-dependent protein kinases|uniref:Crp/Fnr family transcriptional regulator n=3 Tax=Pedobacter panaciterrae TaxID=363849 RepID=A0ABU8NUE2_9SPHI|nr:Crp/Fnr family transcriptional regulator [Pedobacter panaciterrae]NQX53451.1 Crp/Fnr family transcriptional regulator [Pedobacter panaciterrae]
MKKNTKACDLQSCLMCRLVLKEWKLPIENHRKNFLVKKGEVIIKEGDPVNGIYFVNKGKVKIHKTWGDKELIVRFASNGAIIGHRGLSTKSAIFPISATALEATSVCFIDLDFFMSTLKINSDLTFQLMMFYADELQESERRMRNLAHMSVKGRLALSIIQLKDQFGVNDRGHIDIELSRQDLAAFTGTTYETVFRMMNELVREDLISITGKAISVKDPRGLKALTLIA